MSHVSYKISIGAHTIKTPNGTTLKELTVHNALKTPVASASIVLTDSVSAKHGDPVSIELGNRKQTKKVFTGVVKSIEHALESTTIYATSGMESLTRYYADTVYENKSCGAIFKDLAGKIKAKTGNASDGVTFPRYILSSTRSAMRELQVLASYSGTDIFSDENGSFHFQVYKKSPAATFSYGKDLLEVEKESVTPPLDGIVVFGESPGTSASDEKNHWLKKEEIKGTAGKSRGIVYRYTVYAARSKDLCTTIAKNLLKATTVKAHGRALVLNGEQVSLGKTISLKGVPEKSINGNYKVTSIQHRLTMSEGFTTQINWEEPT